MKCGKPRGEGGTETLCAVHAKTLCAYHGDLQRRRIAEGLCVDCGRPTGNDKVRCDTHRAESNASWKEFHRRLFEQRVCPWHKTEMQVLPRCPACLYEAEERIISFEGLLPPPKSGDCLEVCVGCEKCGRLYHEGGSFSAPRHPRGLARKDEFIGQQGSGVWLLYSLGEDEQGRILALYERCSTPDDPCIWPIKKSTAGWYLGRRRSGRDAEEVSGLCWTHSHDLGALMEITATRHQQQLAALDQNDNGQEKGSGKSSGRNSLASSRTGEVINAIASKWETLKDNGRPYESQLAKITQETLIPYLTIQVAELKSAELSKHLNSWFSICRLKEIFSTAPRPFRLLVKTVVDQLKDGISKEKIILNLEARRQTHEKRHRARKAA